jgi:hypothetical protein
MKLALWIIAAIATGGVSAASPRSTEVSNTTAACSIVQCHLVRDGSVPAAGPSDNGWSGWFCENVDYGDSQYYVVTLRSNRACDGLCSNNMGTYAVRRSTGELYEFDVGEWKIGRILTH